MRPSGTLPDITELFSHQLISTVSLIYYGYQNHLVAKCQITRYLKICCEIDIELARSSKTLKHNQCFNKTDKVTTVG